MNRTNTAVGLALTAALLTLSAHGQVPITVCGSDRSAQVDVLNMSPLLRLTDALAGDEAPNASYAIWGGFTDYLSLPDWWTYYYDIQDQDYVLLAESNEEFTTITADGAYDFYVFA